MQELYRDEQHNTACPSFSNTDSLIAKARMSLWIGKAFRVLPRASGVHQSSFVDSWWIVPSVYLFERIIKQIQIKEPQTESLKDRQSELKHRSILCLRDNDLDKGRHETFSRDGTWKQVSSSRYVLGNLTEEMKWFKLRLFWDDHLIKRGLAIRLRRKTKISNHFMRVEMKDVKVGNVLDHLGLFVPRFARFKELPELD